MSVAGFFCFIGNFVSIKQKSAAGCQTLCSLQSIEYKKCVVRKKLIEISSCKEQIISEDCLDFIVGEVRTDFLEKIVESSIFGV